MKTKRICNIEQLIGLISQYEFATNAYIAQMAGVTHGQIRRIKRKLGYTPEKRGRKIKIVI